MLNLQNFMKNFKQELRIRHLEDQEAAAEIGISKQRLSQIKNEVTPPNDQVAAWMGFDRHVKKNKPTITFTKILD